MDTNSPSTGSPQDPQPPDRDPEEALAQFAEMLAGLAARKADPDATDVGEEPRPDSAGAAPDATA